MVRPSVTNYSKSNRFLRRPPTTSRNTNYPSTSISVNSRTPAMHPNTNHNSSPPADSQRKTRKTTTSPSYASRLRYSSPTNKSTITWQPKNCWPTTYNKNLASSANHSSCSPASNSAKNDTNPPFKKSIRK
jgi:hypothetical protein